MPDLILNRYMPHVLLLSAAAIGFAFTTSTTDSHHALIAPSETGRLVQVERPVPGSDAPSDVDPLQASRNLQAMLDRTRGQVLRSFARSQQDERDQPQEETASQPRRIKPDTTQRKVVRRQGMEPLPDAATHASTHLDYIGGDSSEVWQAPGALPERSYAVLQYGEVGDVNPVITSSEQTQEPVVDYLAGVWVEDQTAIAGLAPQVAPAPITLSPVTSPATATPAPTYIQPTTASQVEQTVAAKSVASSHQTEKEDLKTAAQPVASQPVPSLTITDLPSRRQAPRLTEMPEIKAHTEALTPEPLTSAPPTTSRGLTQKAIPESAKPRSEAKAASDTPVVHQPTTKTPPAQPSLHRPTPPAHTQHKQNDPQADNPLVLLIEDADTLGHGRLNAIDNALDKLNRTIEKVGVDMELSYTTDPAANHNILVREEDNHALNGKLGLARSATVIDDRGNERRLGQESKHLGGEAVISLNQDVDWYTEDDALGIGQDQFDYQSTFMHEVMHMLGFADDFSANTDLLMHGYLSPGQTRRGIAEVEQAHLKELYSYANPWKSIDQSFGKHVSRSRQGIRYRSEALTPAGVPEPASLALLSLGITAGLRRQR